MMLTSKMSWDRRKSLSLALTCLLTGRTPIEAYGSLSGGVWYGKNGMVNEATENIVRHFVRAPPPVKRNV